MANGTFGFIPLGSSTPFTPNRNSSGLISTNVQSAIEEVAQVQKGFLSAANTISHTTTISTTSATNVTVGFLNSSGTLVTSITPAAGRYLIVFSADVSTDQTNAIGEMSMFYGNTQQPETLRRFGTTTALASLLALSSSYANGSIDMLGQIVADGTTAVSIQFRRAVAGGTFYVYGRRLALLRVGAN